MLSLESSGSLSLFLGIYIKILKGKSKIQLELYIVCSSLVVGSLVCFTLFACCGKFWSALLCLLVGSFGLFYCLLVVGNFGMFYFVCLIVLVCFTLFACGKFWYVLLCLLNCCGKFLVCLSCWWQIIFCFTLFVANFGHLYVICGKFWTAWHCLCWFWSDKTDVEACRETVHNIDKQSVQTSSSCLTIREYCRACSSLIVFAELNN